MKRKGLWNYGVGLVVWMWMSGLAVAAPPEIMLTGVMQSQGGTAAYIDGKLLRVGDDVSGYTIVSIRHVGITLQNAEENKAYFVPVANPAGIKEVKIITQPEVVETAAQPEPEKASAVEPEPGDDWKAGVSVVGQSNPAEEPANPMSFASELDQTKLIIAFSLIVTGFLINFIAGLWLLVAAFQTSVLWGLGYLFIPFVSLIFLFKQWERAKTPFLIGLIGTLLIYSSWFVMPELFAAIQ